MKKIVDANIVIRFLTDDTPNLTEKIRKYFASSKDCFILTDVTIAEIAWVLESYYELPREEIVKRISALLEEEAFMANRSLIARALHCFLQYNIDYIDAYLAAYAEHNQIETVLSYDRSLGRVKTIRREEP
jgi:predicted nucleic acid-binding protein